MVRAFSFFVLCFGCSALQAQAVPLKVAVFKDSGVGTSAKNVVAVLQQSQRPIAVSRLSAEDIRRGGLSEFQVLVHPGGSGSKQGKALGNKGREIVRKFVKEGGGYLGICAGAYLATNDYSWSLNLIDAKVVDRKHWARGNGDVQLQLSPTATQFFHHPDPKLTIRYGQGPLLGRREWDVASVPDYESLAVFKSEIAKNGAPQGIMIGTSAIVRCRYGAGKVFCFSPHPELTDGKHAWVRHSVQWLSDKHENVLRAQ